MSMLIQIFWPQLQPPSHLHKHNKDFKGLVLEVTKRLEFVECFLLLSVFPSFPFLDRGGSVRTSKQVHISLDSSYLHIMYYGNVFLIKKQWVSYLNTLYEY